MTEDMFLTYVIGISQNCLSIIFNLIQTMNESDRIGVCVDGMNLNVRFEQFNHDSVEDQLLKVTGIKVKVFDHGLSMGNLL